MQNRRRVVSAKKENATHHCQVNNEAKSAPMVEKDNEKILTEILKAVSDATRRSLLTQLCQEGASRVTDLADRYDMSLNAISKHIKVLEKAGLVARRTIGRTHWIEARIDRVKLVENWFKELKSIWELRLEMLEEIMKDGGSQNG